METTLELINSQLETIQKQLGAIEMRQLNIKTAKEKAEDPFEQIQVLVNTLIQDNVKLHVKLDALAKNKEVQHIVSAWQPQETNLGIVTTSTATITASSGPIITTTNIPNVYYPSSSTSPDTLYQFDNFHSVYDYFHYIKADNDKLTTIIGGKQKGTVSMLFYKNGCGGCEPVLKDLKANINKADLESDSLLIIPRNHSFATQLTQKFKIKTYPSLVIIEDSKAILTIEGNKLVKYLIEAFKGELLASNVLL